jgi:hypothetical protein
MSWKRIAVLLCSIAVTGCSSDSDDKDARTRTTPVAEQMAPARAHTGHAQTPTGTPAAPADTGHAQHVADGGTVAQRPTGDAHAAHQPAAGAAAPGHAGHTAAAPQREAMGHAQQAAGRRDTAAHAAHAPAGRDTAGHAAHAPARLDTAAHAAHAPARRDTAAHPAHPPARVDSAQHAAHAQQDTIHAGHRPDSAQQHPAAYDSAAVQHAGMQPEMTMVSLRGGWMAIGMAQLFPTATIAIPADDGTPLGRRGLYLTQPALMFNVESPGSGVSLRTTLNFEGITQPGGELTFGGWGEGFLDKRHPHTFLHEAMLSVSVWAGDGGGFSLSAGKGFAPYGTDDPMSRPVIKYPTNHHLSQILERWTLNAVYASPLWSVEVGVFGGNEPTGPWDFSNIESFANSWSARINRHFGAGEMGVWPWELSASFGRVKEDHGEGEPASVTRLFNAALRHEDDYLVGRVYGLVEGSWSDPQDHDGFFSVVGEAGLNRGIHKPYARVEYASRPEYMRDGSPDTPAFFRYDHANEPVGSTRWLTVVAGYGVTATRLPFSARPYIETQWNRVVADKGGIDPESLFGRSSLLSLSAGFRLFLGGEPMRMGSYGVLDAITLMHRMQMAPMASTEQHRH